jgi:hypothetical protein
MASTQMTSSNALTVKLWAKKGWLNIGQRTVFGHMMDRGAVYFPEELLGQRARGDQITFSYVNKLTGLPVGEGGTLDGNEEALDLGNYQIAMNVTRQGVLNPNEDTIEQQRTNVAFEQNAREVISMRHAEMLDTSVFYQLDGSNPTSFTLNGTTWAGANKAFVQGHNTPVAPSTDRIVRASSSATTDQALTASDKMSLDLIDFMLEKNDLSDQPMQRFADGTFDLYVSPEQLVDLQQDATGKIQWFNIQLAKISGGQADELVKGLSKGGLIVAGRYRDVNIYSAPRVAYGVNASTSAVITTVRRAVMTGKDALTFASPFGGRLSDSDVPLRFTTQMKDYDYYKGIEGRLLYGLKKTTPSNGSDVGVMVCSTYAATHA